MGRGNSRAFVAVVGAVQAMMAGMSKASNKSGENIFSALDMRATAAKAKKHLAKIAGGGIISGCYMPHQGTQECARRVHQGINGTCYVHGAQYNQF